MRMTRRPSQRLSTRMHTGRVFRNSVSGNSSEIKGGENAVRASRRRKAHRIRLKALRRKEIIDDERPFERNGTRDAKSVRPCARDAQTLTPRAGGRVRALRARDASQRRRAAGAQDEKKWESERERWASDEWGCRAVATNRQNQG